MLLDLLFIFQELQFEKKIEVLVSDIFQIEVLYDK